MPTRVLQAYNAGPWQKTPVKKHDKNDIHGKARTIPKLALLVATWTTQGPARSQVAYPLMVNICGKPEET